MADLLQPGDVAPEFDLEVTLGDRLRSADLQGAPYVVFFFPKAGTPG